MSIYDEIADVFMRSLAGELSGITREQFIAHVRAKWPTEDEARKGFEELRGRATRELNEAMRDAAARGKAIVGIGYKVGEVKNETGKK
jgi:hypothetical protein